MPNQPSPALPFALAKDRVSPPKESGEHPMIGLPIMDKGIKDEQVLSNSIFGSAFRESTNDVHIGNPASPSPELPRIDNIQSFEQISLDHSAPPGEPWVNASPIKTPPLRSQQADVTLLPATPEKRRKGKCMSRRSGQNGYIERSGNWYVVLFWQDVVGQEKRKHLRIRICPCSGPGLLSRTERKRKAREIIAASKADTAEYFEKVQAANHVGTRTTFRQQAELWLEHMKNRKRQPIASSTYHTWRSCLYRWLFPKLGALPLSAVDNDPVKELVSEMSASGELGSKSILEYIKVIKAVVASAKDAKTRKPLFPIVWDDEYLDLPVVAKKDQNRPAFDGKIVTALIADAKPWAQVLFVLSAASGLRIGETLGLEIDHLVDDCRIIKIRQKVRHCKVEPYLKTDNAYRDVDIHPDVARMLKAFIANRSSGFVFCTRNGKPLSDSDILSRHLHPALKKLGQNQAGHHAFRRFRVSWLRRQRCPTDLRHFWLGHAGRSVEDDYDRLREDVEFRQHVVKEIGLGFELPPDEVRCQVVPKVAICTEISEVGLAPKTAVNC